jgi:hypothetical protein
MTAGGPMPDAGARAREKTAGWILELLELTTQDLLLGVAGGLPAAFAELVQQLLVAGEDGAAVSVAVAALTRLRSRAHPAESRARQTSELGTPLRRERPLG